MEFVDGAALIALAIFVFITFRTAYRLYIDPLSKFPGPRLAAATRLYEFYFDIVKGGQYTFEIGRMHDEYGPIVRISPYELHCNDPDFIDILYAGGSQKRNKYSFFTRLFGNPQSVITTIDHDQHRMRRAALANFFSKTSVKKLEPLILRCVNLLCRQLEANADTRRPVNLSDAFNCMTADIVTQYSFSGGTHFLDSPDFDPSFRGAINAATSLGFTLKFFPWITPIMLSVPNSLVTRLSPELRSFLQFQKDIKDEIIELKKGKAGTSISVKGHRTIFDEILSGNLPEEEKSLERLWQEGQIVVGGGTETAAWLLSVIVFHLLSNKEIHSRLEMELTQNIPDSDALPTSSELQRLPYLGAVISEGLRISYPVCTRLQRISPSAPMLYKSSTRGKQDYVIPAGTPVGMSAGLLHMRPDIFPEPRKFRPERWLEQRDRQLDRCLLAFSKGSRGCLGINLAYAEIYLALAAVMRRFGSRMTLHDTVAENDIDMVRDRFNPGTKTDGGVRVLIGKV